MKVKWSYFMTIQLWSMRIYLVYALHLEVFFILLNKIWITYFLRRDVNLKKGSTSSLYYIKIGLLKRREVLEVAANLWLCQMR
jgi:hypothetical protein